MTTHAEAWQCGASSRALWEGGAGETTDGSELAGPSSAASRVSGEPEPGVLINVYLKEALRLYLRLQKPKEGERCTFQLFIWKDKSLGKADCKEYGQMIVSVP